MKKNRITSYNVCYTKLLRTLNDVIKTTIFITDMNDFATINEIYASYFGDHRPARSTVAVKTLPANALRNNFV